MRKRGADPLSIPIIEEGRFLPCQGWAEMIRKVYRAKEWNLNRIIMRIRRFRLWLYGVKNMKVRIGRTGGEGGIRTHGSDINRNNRLAGDPDQPLQHLSAVLLMAMCYSIIF